MAAQAGADTTDSAVSATVHIGPDGGGFGLGVELDISRRRAAPEAAQQVADQAHQAHQVCPYSNATRNNTDVIVTVV